MIFLYLYIVYIFVEAAVIIILSPVYCLNYSLIVSKNLRDVWWKKNFVNSIRDWLSHVCKKLSIVDNRPIVFLNIFFIDIDFKMQVWLFTTTVTFKHKFCLTLKIYYRVNILLADSIVENTDFLFNNWGLNINTDSVEQR